MEHFTIDQASTERRVGAVQPDVTLLCAGVGAVAVEVHVTHRVDEPKREALENHFNLAVECDLSYLEPSGVTAGVSGGADPLLFGGEDAVLVPGEGWPFDGPSRRAWGSHQWRSAALSSESQRPG